MRDENELLDSAKAADARPETEKEIASSLQGEPSAQPLCGVVRDFTSAPAVLRSFVDSAARAKIAALEEEIAAIRKEELKKRELIIQNFGRQVEALRSEIEETMAIELNRLQAELAKASTDLAFYKEEYLKAVLSRSWKITRPLRSAMDVKQKLLKLLGHGKPA